MVQLPSKDPASSGISMKTRAVSNSLSSAESLNHSALEGGKPRGVMGSSPPPAQERIDELHPPPIGAALGAHPEVRRKEDALVPRRLFNLSKRHLAACWQDHFRSIFFPRHSRRLLRARNKSTPRWVTETPRILQMDSVVSLSTSLR